MKIKLPERPPGVRFVENRAVGKEFDVRAAQGSTEITIYDEIGMFGVSADDMRRKLDAITTPRIDLRVNSPGGDVFDGIAIYNDLLDHDAEVHVHVSGLAASAASLIAMAGDRIEVADTAFFMIHNAWGMAIGDRNVMTDFAGMLEQIDASLSRVYARRTGDDASQIATLMDAETWFSGPEAVEAGLADAVSGEEPVSALFDLSVFKNTPDALKRRVEAGLREAGYSRREARDAASAGFHTLPRTQREAGEGRSAQREAGAESIAAFLRDTAARIGRT